MPLLPPVKSVNEKNGPLGGHILVGEKIIVSRRQILEKVLVREKK